MKNNDKKTKACLILENIVDLKTQELYGYRLLSRVITTAGEELRFPQIQDKNLKKNLELIALRNSKSVAPKKNLFINLPISLEIDDLPIYGHNFVICLPMEMSLKELAEMKTKIKRYGLRSALDDFYTVGYGTEDIKLGAFDFVFIRDDFYMNTKRSELIKVVYYFKSFGSKVIFKKIDTYKKLELALESGADYGHGYFFGYETYDFVLS